jgi:hypothetical protein
MFFHHIAHVCLLRPIVPQPLPVPDSFDDAQLKLSGFRRQANKLKRSPLSVDAGKSWPTPILTSLGA